jgi:hypothetical protein
MFLFGVDGKKKMNVFFGLKGFSLSSGGCVVSKAISRLVLVDDTYV